MEASTREIGLSQVACLLDELAGKPRINPSDWRGYHPAVYNRHLTKFSQDNMVATLCTRLQSVNVAEYSLEMQIWWRDHQAADKARVEHQLALATYEKEREAALQKLTPHERKLIGL